MKDNTIMKEIPREGEMWYIAEPSNGSCISVQVLEVTDKTIQLQIGDAVGRYLKSHIYMVEKIKEQVMH